MARIVPATDYWISEAAKTVLDGGIVAIPTETVYGLAADAGNANAVAKIFAAKGRPANNPLIVHIATPWEANTGADLTEVAGQYYTLADAFWPGPLTLVLPKRAQNCEIADIVTAGGATVAFRMPAHPVAQKLIQASTNLAAPSANRSEAVSPTQPEHVVESLGDAVDLILDGGPCQVGLESTVLSLAEPTHPRVLRPGAITPEQIAEVLGVMPAYGPVSGSDSNLSAPLAAPGQMRRHYAPATRLIVSDDLARDLILAPPANIGLIARPDDLGKSGLALPPTAALRLLPSDPGSYGRELYRALRELDYDSSVQLIIVSDVPNTPDWLAVRDRLSRASHPSAPQPGHLP